MGNDKPSTQDIFQMLQQKIGNLELTVHAMMDVLDDEEVLDQEKIQDKAQQIVEEMKEGGTETEKENPL